MTSDISSQGEAAPPVLSHINIRTLFLGGIFTLLFLAALRFAGDIAMPVVLAFVVKMVFQPVMHRLERWRVPRKVSAVFIILFLLGGMVTLGTLLSGPATHWAEQFPDSLPQLRERLHFLNQPVEKTQQFLGQAEDMAKEKGPKPMTVVVQGSRLSDKLFTGTQSFASGLLTMMIVLFFLLVSGDTFLRRLVEVLPRFDDKRKAVDISQQVEKDISVYLSTITIMNLLVGVSTGIVMWACGMEDPMLWGSLAFLLNYIPIIGPLTGVVVFFLVGLMGIESFVMALLPAPLYLLIHITEGVVITPMLLARRFTLNPVLVIFALVFWYWMWGFPGAILAVPMLAIVKIICDRIPALSPYGHFLAA